MAIRCAFAAISDAGPTSNRVVHQLGVAGDILASVKRRYFDKAVNDSLALSPNVWANASMSTQGAKPERRRQRLLCKAGCNRSNRDEPIQEHFPRRLHA